MKKDFMTEKQKIDAWTKEALENPEAVHLGSYIAGRSKSLEEKEKEIERLKDLVYSIYRGWFIAFYRATSTMTARQIDHYVKEQWEEIKTKNNL